MKYVQINSVPHGSTGNVMFRQHAVRQQAGDESWVMWGRGRDAEDDHEFNFGSKAGFYLDVARTRIDGRAGFHSKAATRRLIRKLDEIDPDIVHLHNLHGYYVNVQMLFEWLVARQQRTYWTLHDCWAFTGHCAYFTAAGCYEWMTRCDYAMSCPQLQEYPRTYAGRSYRKNYKAKADLFCRMPADKLTLVVPSDWLGRLVKQSCLAKYPVELRRNRVDHSVFKPTKGDFRERHGLEDVFIVLGVANPWTERKGLGDFAELAGMLGEGFRIVLVGLDEKQRDGLPESIIALGATSSAQELAEIYSAADVLFNPTREDNYPMVLLEAQACGTRVVTYDVGGCAEAIREGNGQAVSSLGEAAEAIEQMRG